VSEPLVIALDGYLGFDRAAPLWADLRARLGLDRGAPVREATIDLSKVDGADGGVLALLIQLRSAAEKLGARVDLRGQNERVDALLRLYAARMARPSLLPPPAARGLLQAAGELTLRLKVELAAVLSFVGHATRAVGGVATSPRSLPWRDVARHLEKVGADGLPIVVLIGFLIGLIVAFQSTIQLRIFGAEHLVADAVGISITRALGPLFTAMIIAGRSGAAFAAELGTMRVSEEVDALRTLGLDPYRFLVLPRVLALLLALPILTMISDVMGVLGGFVVGVVDVGMPPAAFLGRVQRAVDLWDVGTGLIKSGCFALSIALISCERGLATSGGAEGVGRATTASVVTGLFSLVVLDTVLTILFMVYGV
jgi:phospholipid/cholesterol/gamma-HCH transport system permease protein